MSFQAYLDNIKSKTGKSPEDFKKIADKKGLLKPGTKAGEIIAWLKKDYGLGHGHAMAVYTVFKGSKEKKLSKDEAIEKHFTTTGATWRPVFDDLMNKVKKFGGDIAIDCTNSYVSILRGERKIAVIQVYRERMDIGIKLKGVSTTDRFEAAGSWNAMMTHRVRVTAKEQIDKELIKWFKNAYEQNATK
jgi:hypothetical protein